MKKYRMLEIIGDGTYGTVWKGISIETGEQIAIKKLKSKIKSWNECVELNEVKSLSKLKAHDNVIKLKEIIKEPNSEVFLIFEYADTNLYEYITTYRKRGEVIPEYKIQSIIKQIVTGLNYIHTNGYFHRDLKPENILMLGDNVKLADFGLAKEIPSFYNNSPMTDYVCTRWYRPPECVLKSTNYTSAMDIWALGCILAELYLLSPLFPGDSEFDQLTKIIGVLGAPKFNDWPEGFKLINKIGMKFPMTQGNNLTRVVKSASRDAIDMMSEIFTWEPLHRPTCTKLLSHPFIDKKGHSGNTNNKFSLDAFQNRFISNHNYDDNYGGNIGLTNHNVTFNNKMYSNQELNNFNYNFYKRNYLVDLMDKKTKMSKFAENEIKYNRQQNNYYKTNENEINSQRNSKFPINKLENHLNNFYDGRLQNISKMYI